jgi:hypothetical protein
MASSRCHEGGNHDDQYDRGNERPPAPLSDLRREVFVVQGWAPGTGTGTGTGSGAVGVGGQAGRPVGT